ncbi:hypothetical protein SLS54_002836 [Diplodia seriata]
MSARRSARIREIPQVSYHEADPEMSDVAIDSEHEAEEEDEDDDDDGSFSPSHAAKKRKRTATVTKRQKKQKKAKADIFRWADLPSEIKNMIYELALIEQQPFEIEVRNTPVHSKNMVRRVRKGPERWLGLPPLALGLLLLNKQTYVEAAPILYSRNVFEFPTMRAAFYFLCPLGPETKTWILSIKMCDTADYPAWTVPTFYALIGVTNLQCLDIPVVPDMKRFFRNTYHWLEAVGRQRGDNTSLNLDGTNPDGSRKIGFLFFGLYE